MSDENLQKIFDHLFPTPRDTSNDEHLNYLYNLCLNLQHQINKMQERIIMLEDKDSAHTRTPR